IMTDYRNIEFAKLFFNENGTPVSVLFDDIYFANNDGMQECDYVFIEGNHLATRLLTSTSSHFTIAETGFGTGLNFQTLIYQYQLLQQHDTSKQLPAIHYISIEKYPLQTNDLQRIWQAHPLYHQPQVQQLLQQWPT